MVDRVILTFLSLDTLVTSISGAWNNRNCNLMVLTLPWTGNSTKVTPVNFDFKLGNYTIDIEIAASQLPSADSESPHGRCRKRK